MSECVSVSHLSVSDGGGINIDISDLLWYFQNDAVITFSKTCWTICAAVPHSLANWLDDGFDWQFHLPNQVEPSSTWRRTSSQQRRDSGGESPTSSWSWPTADLRTTSTRSLRRCRWQVRDVLLMVPWFDGEALKKVPDCQFQACLACLVSFHSSAVHLFLITKYCPYS